MLLLLSERFRFELLGHAEQMGAGRSTARGQGTTVLGQLTKLFRIVRHRGANTGAAS